MPPPVKKIDEGLLRWASPYQAECLKAINEHRTLTAAAKAMGRQQSAVSESIKRLKAFAAAKGYSPEHGWTNPVPDPHIAKGVSTYYDKDGKVRGQWVKSRIDDEALALVREAIGAALAEEVRGLAPLTKPPALTNDDLLVVIPWGDPHFGMYAWAEEAGENFDLHEAERLTRGAVDTLIALSPPASTALILPLGDFFHLDNQTNRTPQSGHQLDADGRFAKVLRVGIQALRHATLRALEKFGRVIVRPEQGNHDPTATIALRAAMEGYFHDEPRVTIESSPANRWYYRHGKVLIGATHGDEIKQDQMLGVMATDRPEDWGATKHRYYYSGHVHTSGIKEYPGVICESFRTLAARDAWSTGAGYRAGRDMRAIVHHSEHGQVAMFRCDIGML